MDILKDRISTLEQEQVHLRCTNTKAQKVIKDLEDGNPPQSPKLVTRGRITKSERFAGDDVTVNTSQTETRE